MLELQEIIKKNVIKHRKISRLTQKELAEKAGISTTYIGEIESCRKYPSIKTLVKISKALEVEPYMLLIDPELHKNDVIMRYNTQLRTEFDLMLEKLEVLQ